MPTSHPSTRTEEFKDSLSYVANWSPGEETRGLSQTKEKLCTEGMPSVKSVGFLSNKLTLVWGTDPLLPAGPPAHSEFTFTLCFPKEPVRAVYSSKHS